MEEKDKIYTAVNICSSFEYSDWNRSIWPKIQHLLTEAYNQGVTDAVEQVTGTIPESKQSILSLLKK